MGNTHPCRVEKLFAIAVESYFAKTNFDPYNHLLISYMAISTVEFVLLQCYLLHYFLAKATKIENKSFHYLMSGLIQVTIMLNIVPSFFANQVFQVI
jgi:hypothetical protein